MVLETRIIKTIHSKCNDISHRMSLTGIFLVLEWGRNNRF
jgi:hypothetical protein